MPPKLNTAMPRLMGWSPAVCDGSDAPELTAGEDLGPQVVAKIPVWTDSTLQGWGASCIAMSDFPTREGIQIPSTPLEAISPEAELGEKRLTELARAIVAAGWEEPRVLEEDVGGKRRKVRQYLQDW